jgi:hypothetical protein
MIHLIGRAQLHPKKRRLGPCRSFRNTCYLTRCCEFYFMYPVLSCSLIIYNQVYSLLHITISYLQKTFCVSRYVGRTHETCVRFPVSFNSINSKLASFFSRDLKVMGLAQKVFLCPSRKTKFFVRQLPACEVPDRILVTTTVHVRSKASCSAHNTSHTEVKCAFFVAYLNKSE